jgi:hypothetical protein
MPSRVGAASSPTRRYRSFGKRLLLAAALASAAGSAVQAQERPSAAVLLDRLCAQTMRPNEEDRLFGVISVTVRTTIKYEGGVFSPDLIDDAVQDGLGATLAACPTIAKTADAERLGMVVGLIRDATVKRLQDADARYSEEQTEKASAADLSEELSAPEIDAWLDALAARQRALALALYASDVTHDEIADAVGLPPGGLADALHGVKGDLLNFFRADWEAAVPPPIPAGPAMEYHEAGQGFGTLLMPASTAAASVRVTGISRDIYGGWSLLATVTGLPADRSLQLDGPVLLAADEPGHRRMIAVALDEISDPHSEIRRFLVKAYAIDADKDGADLHEGFHLAAARIDNAAALRTLSNHTLAAIEIARCLAFDYGTAADPGFCR